MSVDTTISHGLTTILGCKLAESYQHRDTETQFVVSQIKSIFCAYILRLSLLCPISARFKGHTCETSRTVVRFCLAREVTAFTLLE